MLSAGLFGLTTFPIYSVAAAHAHDFASADERVELSAAALMFLFAVWRDLCALCCLCADRKLWPAALFAMISDWARLLVIFGLVRDARPPAPDRAHALYLCPAHHLPHRASPGPSRTATDDPVVAGAAQHLAIKGGAHQRTGKERHGPPPHHLRHPLYQRDQTSWKPRRQPTACRPLRPLSAGRVATRCCSSAPPTNTAPLPNWPPPRQASRWPNTAPRCMRFRHASQKGSACPSTTLAAPPRRRTTR